MTGYEVYATDKKKSKSAVSGLKKGQKGGGVAVEELATYPTLSQSVI